MSIVHQSTASLDTTRRKILYDLLQERHRYNNVPEYYIEQEMDFYLESLQNGKPITTLRPQEELTDALSINDEMKEFEIDIHTIYHQLNHMSERITQHQKLNESVINDIRIRINKTDDEIAEVGHLLRNEDAHSIHFETFLDYKNKENDHSYYTERDGHEVAHAYDLTIDSYQNSLKLPTLYKENKLINFAGVPLARIHLSKQIGSGFIRSRNPDHSIEKAIDDSMDTYWNETILTDEPLRVDLGLEYYGVGFGATCELEINFDYATSLNEITLTPFTEYPLEIVSILVYTTDDEEEKAYELVSPYSTIQNKESTEVMNFQFQQIVAKRIKILLNQQHYVKRDILLHVDDKTIIDTWLQHQEHIEIDEDRIFKPIEQDQMEMNPYWQYLKSYMDKRNIIEEIQRYEDVDFSNQIQISKYEYQYGLYNIAVNRNEYFYEGVYVTKQLSHSNIHVVQLETVEEHPILENINMPVTHIEYYVTDVDHPKPDDWVSILSTNIKEIISERLFPSFLNGRYQALTRFGIDNIRAVRKNGTKITAHHEFQSSGNYIILYDFDPSAVYTIDYKPTPNAYQVDFLSKYTTRYFSTERNRMVEEIKTKTAIEDVNFIGTGNEIELKHHPFLDKNKINLIEENNIDWNPTFLSNTYLPFKIRLILPDGEYVDQRTDEDDDGRIYITNKTDYYDQRRSLLEPFTGENYQYRIERNKIKLNTKLPEGTRITCEYPYLTGPIRMKIIMRRNLHEIKGLTPFLHEYKLIFQSLN